MSHMTAHFIGGEWNQVQRVMEERDLHGYFRVAVMPQMPTSHYEYESTRGEKVVSTTQEYRLVWRDRDTAVYKLIDLIR